MLPRKTKIFFLIICLLIAAQTIRAEHISLKFSYKTNSIKVGDVNDWIESYNNLWNDWQSRHGGQLTGGFSPLNYGSNLDFELRIPIYAGLGFSLGGGRHTSSGEGTITFQNATGNQTETQFISNRTTAYPFKLGFSYYFAIPSFERLSIFAGLGRQIIFIKYNSQDNYSATFVSNGKEFNYWYNKDDKYSSEALGTYISFGLEFEIIQYLAVFIEAEKTWSKIGGFKSKHAYEGFLGENNFREGGKASLYFYESNQWGLGQYYSILTGYKQRPDESYIQNIRQGEFDLSNSSFKIGLRLKF